MAGSKPRRGSTRAGEDDVGEEEDTGEGEGDRGGGETAGADDGGDEWSADGGLVAEPAPAAASSGMEAVPTSSATVNR